MANTHSEENPLSSGGEKSAPSVDVDTYYENLLSCLENDDHKEVRSIIKKCPDVVFKHSIIEQDNKKVKVNLLDVCLFYRSNAVNSLNYILGCILRESEKSKNAVKADELLWNFWVSSLQLKRWDLIKKIIDKKRKFLTEITKEGMTNLHGCVTYGASKILKEFLSTRELSGWVNKEAVDSTNAEQEENSPMRPIDLLLVEYFDKNISLEQAIELATILIDHGAYPSSSYNWREYLSGADDTELLTLFERNEKEHIEKFETALILEDTTDLKTLLELDEKFLYFFYGEESQLIEVFCMVNNKYRVFKWLLENYLYEKINDHDFTEDGERCSPPMIYQPLELFKLEKCTEEDAIRFAELMIENGADVSVKVYVDTGYVNWREFIDQSQAPRLYALYEKYDRTNPGSEIYRKFLRSLLSDKELNYNAIKTKVAEDPAFINARDDTDRNVLHIAITRRDFKLFDLFLSRFPSMTSSVFQAREDRDEEQDYYVFSFDARDASKRTPLLLAIELAANEEEAIPYVRELLKKGADPSLSNLDNISPLHRAAAKGFRNIVKALIDSAIVGFHEREFRRIYAESRNEIQKNVVDANIKDSLGMNLFHYALSHGETGIFDVFKHGQATSYDFRVVGLCFEADEEGHMPFYAGLNQKDLDVRKKVNDFIASLHLSALKAIGELTSSPRLKRSRNSERDESQTGETSEESREPIKLPVKKNPKQKLQRALTKLAQSIEIQVDPVHEYQKRRNEKSGLLSLTILALLYELQAFPESQQKIADSFESATNSVMQTIEAGDLADRVHNIQRLIKNFLYYGKEVCTDLDAQKKVQRVARYVARLVLGSQGLEWLNDIIGIQDGDSGEESAGDEEIVEPKLSLAIKEMPDEDAVIAYLEELSDKEKRQGEKDKDTPLHYAADMGYAKLLGRLVNLLQAKEGVDDGLDQANELHYYDKNSLGMNFLHNAFRNGHIHIAREFTTADDYYDRFFGFLVRQKDNEGDNPIYVGMTSKNPHARKMTAEFLDQLSLTVNSKINGLENELDNWDSAESVIRLKSLLKNMTKRIKYFEKPKFDILKRHNVDAVLVNLTILDLIRDLRELGESKDANNLNAIAAGILDSFMQNAKNATEDDLLFDIILTVVLEVAAIVAGVTLGILLGALIAYLTGITAIVFLGLCAFEIAGASVLGVATPVVTFIASQKCLFGFQHDIKEACSIVDDMIVQPII